MQRALLLAPILIASSACLAEDPHDLHDDEMYGTFDEFLEPDVEAEQYLQTDHATSHEHHPIDLGNLGIQDFPLTSGDISQAPASGVSFFQILEVGSVQFGAWESVSNFQSTTAYDHGGAQIGVTVFQYGYGNGGASLAGASPDITQSIPICGTATLHECTVGEDITGYLRVYYFNGPQYGSFSAFTNSVASPFGYWSDQIYIQ